MKVTKFFGLMVVLVFALMACAPGGLAEEVKDGIEAADGADLAFEQLEAELAEALQERDEFQGSYNAMQVTAGNLEERIADLEDALKQFTEAATEPTDEPADPPVGVCAPKYLEEHTVGFVKDDAYTTGRKDNLVSVEIDCVLFSITFSDGSYLYGQLAEDGRSSVWCKYNGVSNGLEKDCTLSIKKDPNVFGMDRANTRGDVLKVDGRSDAIICLAVERKAYNDLCSVAFDK